MSVFKCTENISGNHWLPAKWLDPGNNERFPSLHNSFTNDGPVAVEHNGLLYVFTRFCPRGTTAYCLETNASPNTERDWTPGYFTVAVDGTIQSGARSITEFGTDEGIGATVYNGDLYCAYFRVETARSPSEGRPGAYQYSMDILRKKEDEDGTVSWVSVHSFLLPAANEPQKYGRPELSECEDKLYVFFRKDITANSPSGARQTYRRVIHYNRYTLDGNKTLKLLDSNNIVGYSIAGENGDYPILARAYNPFGAENYNETLYVAYPDYDTSKPMIVHHNASTNMWSLFTSIESRKPTSGGDQFPHVASNGLSLCSYGGLLYLTFIAFSSLPAHDPLYELTYDGQGIGFLRRFENDQEGRFAPPTTARFNGGLYTVYSAP